MNGNVVMAMPFVISLFCGLYFLANRFSLTETIIYTIEIFAITFGLFLIGIIWLAIIEKRLRGRKNYE